MAFTFGFYNSINHDRRYDAVQVGQIFDGIIKDGVYETYKKAMIVKASSNDNQVIVQPGRAWFNHTWSYNDADLPVSMPGPETFNQRIDAVVLDINSANANRRNSIQVVKGTPNPNNPTSPTLIHTTEHNQYPLCYVKRTGGVNTIYQRDITNTVGTSACPFVIGVIEGLSVDEFLSQWTDEFKNYMNSKKSEWNAFQNSQTHRMEQYEREFFAWMENEKVQYYGFLDHNETAWRNWFDHIRRELDGDIAGHLQTQIDEIAKFAHIYVVDKVLYVPMSGASIQDKKLIINTYGQNEYSISWLRGKKVSIIGDSVSTFNQEGYKLPDYRMYYPRGDVNTVDKTWWYKIIDNSEALLEVNASYSGSRATAREGWPDFYERVDVLGSPDVVFVALGVNDSRWSIPLGEYDFSNNYKILSENTFRTAYIKGVKALQDLYPNAIIVCIALEMLNEYASSIEYISKRLNTVYVNSGSYDVYDGPHPNAAGMKQIASNIAITLRRI